MAKVLGSAAKDEWRTPFSFHFIQNALSCLDLLFSLLLYCSFLVQATPASSLPNSLQRAAASSPARSLARALMSQPMDMSRAGRCALLLVLCLPLVPGLQ